MIKFVGIGKTTHGFIKEGCAEYLKRLNRYCKTEETYLSEIANASSYPAEEIKKREALLLQKKLTADDLLITLDENGKQFSSIQLASQLDKWLQLKKHVVFMIGGAYGLHETIRAQSHQQWSLSQLTFNHQMVRLVLAEQLYRAFTIINNEPYHHG